MMISRKAASMMIRVFLNPIKMVCGNIIRLIIKIKKTLKTLALSMNWVLKTIGKIYLLVNNRMIVIGNKRCINLVERRLISANESFNSPEEKMGTKATLIALAINNVKGNSLAPNRNIAKTFGVKFLETIIPSM